MTPIRVLLVDDEPDFLTPVMRFLTKAGMQVVGVGSVEDMDAALEDFQPDIIVLDVNLPGENGFDAVHRLRQNTKAGLVMLTARTEIDDRVFGLTQGADAYFTKPVTLRELEAAIRNLWGRLHSLTPVPTEPWIFDAGKWTLTSPDGKPQSLSAAEYRLLSILADTPGQPVERDVLCQALGRATASLDDRGVDLLISRLRRKFAGADFSLPIKSVRGIGYVFPEPVITISKS